MSQKIKNNKFLIIFNILNLILFIFASKNLNNLLVYSVFSFISIISINYFLITWRYYTEIFLNIFIFLGFWFNFSFKISKSHNLPISETNNFLSNLAIQDNYAQVLNIISISILSITIFFILIKKFFFKINKKKSSFIFLNFILKKYKITFFICFLTLFLFIIFLNSHYDFARLGQQTSGFVIFEKLFKYLLMILFPLFIVLIADLYLKTYRISLKLILFIIICLFAISLTLESRAFIIFLLPIFLVYFKFIKNLKSIAIIFVSSITLFLILFILVYQARTNTTLSYNQAYNIVKKISYLTTDRWIGMAGMINVNYTKNKNIKMFLDSFSESSQIFNYYEKNYFYSQDESQPNFMSKKKFMKQFKEAYKPHRISVYVPGFMAYFYYSGSLILLIFLNLFMILVLISVEKFLSLIIGNKKFFLAMFSMIFVWRIVHFGLFPFNSILFFLVLTLTPIIFLLIDKLLLYLHKRIK